jgi:prephenate dehydratase
MSIELDRVAFLGPDGSYTALALTRSYKVRNAVSCSSISQVLESVRSGTVPWGFVPLENMLQGPVSETIDLLSRYHADLCIVDSALLTIDHCLAAPAATTLADIKEVLSHEQALQQCAEFLDREVPQARRTATSSTALAAELVAAQTAPYRAAICSRSTVAAFGLLPLVEDIAAATNNKTRFALVGKKSAVGSVTPSSTQQRPWITAIALDPGRDRQGILHEVLHIISVEHRCNLVSIHSRPDQRGGFVFYLDLEGAESEPQVANALAALRRYCRDVTSQTAALLHFGSFPCEPFHAPAFKRIAILGSDGVMGRWFTEFFKRTGFEVAGYDRLASHSLSDVVNSSDVLLLSVPMSEMSAVASELATLVRPGQLIVENASIKNTSLPLLAAALPAGTELLGMHTMFGGAIESLREQNIIFTKVESSSTKAKAFEDLFYKQGAFLSYLSSDEHDKVAAALQAVMHSMLISLAGVLEQHWDSVDQLRAFTTPNSRPVLEAIERVVQQSDSLVADMQLLNPQSEKLRHEFLEQIVRLVFSLDHSDRDVLESMLSRAREFFRRS